MKILLKIWLTQLRRDFKWGKFLGEAYFAFLFITLSIVITLVVREEVGDVTGMEKALPFIAVSMIIPDFIHKLLMKHDETVMDHYLKSRPIPERSWNRFLLTTNLFSFWNWTIPFLLLPFCVLFLPWILVVPSFLLLFAVSLVGGVAITAFRRAKGWTNKWPVLVAMVIWAIIAFMYSLVGILTPWGIHVTGFLLLCAGGIAVFYDYLCDLHRYDESQARADRLLLGASSLFSMEYISVLRSKRLRVAALILPLVFLFNTYSQIPNGLNWMFYMMLMFAVFSPSMMLGQWVFGIEGNYFDGLWTKPVSIREILGNKFRFYALLNIIPTLMVAPLIWMAGLSPWLLLATWLFTAGFANLSLMPTALISSRIELFQSAFFNYQGASLSVNLYGFVVIIPIALYCLFTWLLSPETCAIVLALTGIVGFALYPVIIGWLSRAYERRRYTCFERYRQ
jgi:hypothetical protein